MPESPAQELPISALAAPLVADAKDLTYQLEGDQLEPNTRATVYALIADKTHLNYKNILV